MSRRKIARLPPFVPLYKETMKTGAWIAMSHGAKMLYVVLKWHYNTKLGNHVFVSTRDAASKLGSNRNCVRRWFRELQYYGFIVMIRPGGLGVEGRGKAPHWRLTEEWYLDKSPTRDFLLWDGTLFREQKRPSKIRLPGSKSGAALGPKVVPLALRNAVKNRKGGSKSGAIHAHQGGSKSGAITSLATGLQDRGDTSDAR